MKIEYQLVAESAKMADKLLETSQNQLQFPYWCPGWESNPHVLANTTF